MTLATITTEDLHTLHRASLANEALYRDTRTTYRWDLWSRVVNRIRAELRTRGAL